MAGKLRLPSSSVVANGVDENLALVEPDGDGKNRVIVLGHFFEGRTDLRLIEEIASIRGIDEIIVGGLREDNEFSQRIRRILDASSAEFVDHAWLDLRDVGQLAGENTVALIPHVVTDYTISQNLMKAFQFAALGIPAICPMLLWPTEIDMNFAYLTGYGTDMSRTLVPWIESVDRPDGAYRTQFVRENSWTARAQSIAERLANVV